jgi:hypothetical protein
VLVPSKPYLGFIAASAGILGEVTEAEHSGVDHFKVAVNGA